MEEEIDLRPYIEAVIKHWYWIVGAAILAALVAFGIASFLPPNYEATSLVAIKMPEELVLTSLATDNLEPNFVSRDEQISYLSAFPELATSDQLLQNLFESIDPPLEEVNNVEELRKLLKVETGNDPTLIRLTANYHDPTIVATIVNTWANLYVPWVNEVFGSTGTDKLELLETQLSEALILLENSEDALVQNQSENPSNIIENQLDFSLQRQADLLEEQNDLAALTRDVEDLTSEIESLPNGSTATIAHQLTALNLQLEIFDAEVDRLPLQLRIDDSTNIIGSDKRTQIAFLTSLLDVINTRETQVAADITNLEQAILILQADKQKSDTSNNRYYRLYAEAEESYVALGRMVERERLNTEDTTTGVRLVSMAISPEEPAGSGRLVIVLVAAILSGLVAFLTILFRQWYRGAF